MLGTLRGLEPILAAGAVLLLLCGALCLFEDSAGLDLCLLILAIAGTALATFGLQPVGWLVPTLTGSPCPALAEGRSPPPKR